MFLFSSLSSADSVRNKGGRVFVHCQAGISRSATICLAYLMRTNRVKLDEAFEFVKQRRSIISPNFSFMGQLLQFESQVLASSTCSSEASSPAIGNSSTVFNFPVSIPVHASAGQLSFLHSPITTSPSCWGICGEHRLFGLELQFTSDSIESIAQNTHICKSVVILVSPDRLGTSVWGQCMWLRSTGQISVRRPHYVKGRFDSYHQAVFMFSIINVKVIYSFNHRWLGKWLKGLLRLFL